MPKIFQDQCHFSWATMKHSGAHDNIINFFKKLDYFLPFENFPLYGIM